MGSTYELKFINSEGIRGRFNVQMLYPYKPEV